MCTFNLEILPQAIQQAVREKLDRYYSSVNAEDFQTTTNLFAQTGVLFPPFDRPITGRTDILKYFQTEAIGMKVFPERYLYYLLESESYGYQVNGKVQTPHFTINVNWNFVFDDNLDITILKVKLLAKFEDLLNLNHPQSLRQAS